MSEPLTSRELDVLQRIADGKINREIGVELLIGLETVKSRVKDVLAKLGARNRTHAVAIAFREGLIR